VCATGLFFSFLHFFSIPQPYYGFLGGPVFPVLFSPRGVWRDLRPKTGGFTRGGIYSHVGILRFFFSISGKQSLGGGRPRVELRGVFFVFTWKGGGYFFFPLVLMGGECGGGCHAVAGFSPPPGDCFRGWLRSRGYFVGFAK